MNYCELCSELAVDEGLCASCAERLRGEDFLEDDEFDAVYFDDLSQSRELFVEDEW